MLNHEHVEDIQVARMLTIQPQAGKLSVIGIRLVSAIDLPDQHPIF